MKPIILLAIATWMTPWRYRMEMPAPPSLYAPLDGLPLVRPQNWSPRLCCPHKPTAFSDV